MWWQDPKVLTLLTALGQPGGPKEVPPTMVKGTWPICPGGWHPCTFVSVARAILGVGPWEERAPQFRAIRDMVIKVPPGEERPGDLCLYMSRSQVQNVGVWINEACCILVKDWLDQGRITRECCVAAVHPAHRGDYRGTYRLPPTPDPS